MTASPIEKNDPETPQQGEGMVSSASLTLLSLGTNVKGHEGWGGNQTGCAIPSNLK